MLPLHISHLLNRAEQFFSFLSAIVHWLAEIQTKDYYLTIYQVNEFALTQLTAIFHFCKIVVKTKYNLIFISVDV